MAGYRSESIYEDVANLTTAANRALVGLSNMTSDQFARGEDRPIRDELAKALGYIDFQNWADRDA